MPDVQRVPPMTSPSPETADPPFKIHRFDVDQSTCFHDQASGPRCANDAHYRLPTYDDWMGHSPAVNGPHYCAKCGAETADLLTALKPHIDSIQRLTSGLRSVRRRPNQVNAYAIDIEKHIRRVQSELDAALLRLSASPQAEIDAQVAAEMRDFARRLRSRDVIPTMDTMADRLTDWANEIAARPSASPAPQKGQAHGDLLCTSCGTHVAAGAWVGACPTCGNGTMREVPAPQKGQDQ